MNNNSTMQPRKADDVLVQTMDQETILISVGKGQYYTLNEVGSRVWALCDGTNTLEAIVARIREEFDADPTQIAEDVRAVIDDLLAEKLVAPNDSQV